LAVVFLSSLVALLPFSRDSSISNFIVYGLLPIILVYANRSKFEAIGKPSGGYLLIALGIIGGSFLFNYASGLIDGSFTYGLTDYVILVCGIFALFYTLENPSVRFGIVLLVAVRGITLGLGLTSGSLFESVSSFFVWIVIAISQVLVSPTIHAGSIPGRIVVGGASEGSQVGIGWACAGLEELVIISVILYILIDSFRLGRKQTTYWLLLGIAGSFVINIARMVILVAVAYSYGMSEMLWVHTHLGDVLFLAWIGIFWMFFFKYGSPSNDSSGGPPSTEPS
jgi:exosortase/archaeosortase family protein